MFAVRIKYEEPRELMPSEGVTPEQLQSGCEAVLLAACLAYRHGAGAKFVESESSCPSGATLCELFTR